ncbi:hypothetical protein GCM10017608_25590 [Agromyces luteolus]|uniref:DUF1998 domain-containing protein n=1 Tax=Agromyces luteolus TaxID=88373 RepID=A0A7C9MJV3_9MICO|nr:DUF1998 domain-containing protein [Agromyces luteolus]MUN08938.1 DUF1998 domain-containing protein [Agromyces luteolus]GLK28624.1 hypothetical protein GCM10017608_25590 [Agromyces luteolus]
MDVPEQVSEDEMTESPAEPADATTEPAAGEAATGTLAGVPGEIADTFLDDDQKSKNRGRVGSIRPNGMLYTAGIGSTVDLPHLAVMPQGLDAWEKAYSRQGGAVFVQVPRLLDAVRRELGPLVQELRQPPWVPDDDAPIGIPTRIFPAWLRCTGCDRLAPESSGFFVFENTNKYRPDQARFVHKACKGRPGKGRKEGVLKPRPRPAVPARYLIACTNGHLDEFPYKEWLHREDGNPIECKVPNPALRMREYRSNLGPAVELECVQCGATRNIAEVTRAGGEKLLPACRGRHPHLPTWAPADKPCTAEVRLMLLGAANQWFPTTVSVLVLPARKVPTIADLALEVMGLPAGKAMKLTSVEQVAMWREWSPEEAAPFSGVPAEQIVEAVKAALYPAIVAAAPADAPVHDQHRLLIPEWETLTHPSEFETESRRAGFKVHSEPVPEALAPVVADVVAVDRIRKANAFTGFTRIDAPDRVGGERARIAPIAQNGRPTWVPATEDRGEGVFLRFAEDAVVAWEAGVLRSDVWADHVAAHKRNLKRRESQTGIALDAEAVMPPPRYWALHTISHLMIREMAMSSGYGSASIAERIYAWTGTDEREPAAGILITTTSPDSEGTLGGLVDLARTARLDEVMEDAIHRAGRCSSDPICADRVPKGQEDFLHGAACHFCLFLSETSCERANRFLDRRFALKLGAGSKDAAPLLEHVHWTGS